MALTERDQSEERERRIEPREHGEPDGIPFYDAELDVPQSAAHRKAVYDLGSVLETVATEAGLQFLSDEPIWYLHPESDDQRTYFGDCVLGIGADTRRITAEDVRVVIEVVTTSDRRKEIKDTGFQRVINEYNAVPEFGLVFPEADDARALTWCRLEGGRYAAVDVAPGGRVAVSGVPGLELRVKPREQWALGDKLEVFFRGEPRLPLALERKRADSAEARADTAEARADTAEARAERLAARLRELGEELPE